MALTQMTTKETSDMRQRFPWQSQIKFLSAVIGLEVRACVRECMCVCVYNVCERKREPVVVAHGVHQRVCNRVCVCVCVCVCVSNAGLHWKMCFGPFK